MLNKKDMIITDVSPIIEMMFEDELKMREFIYEWLTFTLLVSMGGFTRAIYNYDREKSIRFFTTFKLIVFTFVVSFIAKHIIDQTGHQVWEIWLIPIIAFLGEVVIATLGDKAPDLISTFLERINDAGIAWMTKKKKDEKKN